MSQPQGNNPTGQQGAQGGGAGTGGGGVRVGGGAAATTVSGFRDVQDVIRTFQQDSSLMVRSKFDTRESRRAYPATDMPPADGELFFIDKDHTGDFLVMLVMMHRTTHIKDKIQLLFSAAYHVVTGGTGFGQPPQSPLNPALAMKPFRRVPPTPAAVAAQGTAGAAAAQPVQQVQYNYVDPGPVADATILDGYNPERSKITGALLNSFPANASAGELAAYVGIYVLAGVKKPTPANMTAFNEKRAPSIRAYIGETTPLRVFVPGSAWITNLGLSDVYAGFNQYKVWRRHFVRWANGVDMVNVQGPPIIFKMMFSLLDKHGLSPIFMIADAIRAYPQVVPYTEHLLAEWQAFYKAWGIMHAIPANERLVSKAIWGNDFVPVDQASIKRLFFICRELLQKEQPSYQNYAGGQSNTQDAAIVQDILIECNMAVPP